MAFGANEAPVAAGYGRRVDEDQVATARRPTSTGTRWAPIWRRARADAVPLAAFGVFFVAGCSWLAHAWHPVEDLAITELMVRQIPHHTPLSGAYSSLPFHHPGPLLFWYLWGPYELFGQRSSALAAATIWFNGAVLAVVLAVARRLGGPVLAVLAAGAVLLWSAEVGLPRLWEPWNPYVGALPMVAIVLLTWAMLERQAWALPLAVALATWCAQAHIQFVPVAIPLVGLGLVALVVREWRTDGRAGLRALRGPVAIAAGLGALLWLPVLADVIVHGHASNPAAIGRYYLHGPRQVRDIDPRDEWWVLRSALSLHPMWAGGPRAFHLYLVPTAKELPLALLFDVLAVAGAWRRRAARELRGIAVGVVALALAMVALAQVTGPNLAEWYLISVDATALALDVLVAASLVATIRWLLGDRLARVPARVGAAAPTVAGLATIALVVATTLSFHRLNSEQVSARVADRILPKLEARVPASRAVLVEGRNGLGGWVQASMALQLDKAGYDTYARGALVGKFPPAMEAAPPDGTVRFIVLTDPTSERWLPGVHVVARVRYGLEPTDPPFEVVVVEAPLHAVYLTADGT